MGRFARSQNATTSTSRARRPNIIARLDFSRGHEIKSNEFKSQVSDLDGQRAKGIKYFCIVLVSLIGLSAGWIMGQSWMNSTQVAAIEPSVYAEELGKSGQASEENANPSALPEQGAQPSQAIDDSDRKSGKARRVVARAPRARGQEASAAGPVTMVLKPFKAINPMKLRKLRPW
jgi:hypothetical protein